MTCTQATWGLKNTTLFIVAQQGVKIDEAHWSLLYDSAQLCSCVSGYDLWGFDVGIFLFLCLLVCLLLSNVAWDSRYFNHHHSSVITPAGVSNDFNADYIYWTHHCALLLWSNRLSCFWSLKVLVTQGSVGTSREQQGQKLVLDQSTRRSGTSFMFVGSQKLLFRFSVNYWGSLYQ